MSKIVDFPFLLKRWTGSEWKYIGISYADLRLALIDASYCINVSVFLHPDCLSGDAVFKRW